MYFCILFYRCISYNLSMYIVTDIVLDIVFFVQLFTIEARISTNYRAEFSPGDSCFKINSILEIVR